MVKRIRGLTFSSLECRRAKLMTREEIREDMELYLYSIFKAQQLNDRELLDSAKKDLEKTERLLVCQSFLQIEKIPTSELKEKNRRMKK